VRQDSRDSTRTIPKRGRAAVLDGHCDARSRCWRGKPRHAFTLRGLRSICRSVAGTRGHADVLAW